MTRETPGVPAGTVVRLTPAAPAAIAVVRLAGPGVTAFLQRRFSRPATLSRAVHGLLRDEDGVVVDDPVVVLCDAATADLNLHGGTWVVRSAMRLAERNGFRIVEQDAAPADGLTPLWTEVLAALPTAATPAAVGVLLAQPAAWDAVLERGDGDQIRAVLADPSGRWLLAPPVVAVVGPANVGKSTLANALFGRARSITADVPGTTRDWVGGVADLDGLAVDLIDTPGVRSTGDPIEAAALVAARSRTAEADLILLVLDRSIPMGDAERTLLALYPGAMRIANKADVQPAWDLPDALPTVAVTGRGVDAVRSAVRQRFGFEPVDPTRPRWWTERQRAVLAARLSDGVNGSGTAGG